MTKVTDNIVATWQRVWNSAASAVIVGMLFWISSTMVDLDKRVAILQHQMPQVVEVKEQVTAMNFRLHVCEKLHNEGG